MSEEERKPTAELIGAGVELVKVAYGDAIQPLAREAGRALGTLGKTVNAALAPLRGLVWGWEKIEVYLSAEVERKLAERGTPEGRVTTPDPDIAVPAIEALRYSKLRDNFANLLATAMDADTLQNAHPAFVEILKQLTPDEARILGFLPRFGSFKPLLDLSYKRAEAGEFLIYRRLTTLAQDTACANADALPQLIDNLCRLGLTEVPPLRHLVEDFRYDRIRALDIYVKLKTAPLESVELVEHRLMLGVTALGQSFRRACIETPPAKSATE